MLFDNRWNQHTCTSLTLLPFGLWAPGVCDATFYAPPVGHDETYFCWRELCAVIALSGSQ